MTRNDRFPFRQGEWGELWAASMVLLHTMAWQRQRDTRLLRATSPRWWGHLFALVCIWTMGWFANPAGFAAYRCCPAAGGSVTSPV